MKLAVKPRLQYDRWSLYWKESMATRTELLEPIEVGCAATRGRVDAQLFLISLPLTQSAKGLLDLLGTEVLPHASPLPQVDVVPGDSVADACRRAARQLGWQDAVTLLPLEGFEGPWEMALCKVRVGRRAEHKSRRRAFPFAVR